MKIFYYILLLCPIIVVYSVNKDDLDFLRIRLKQHKAEVIKELQETEEIASDDDTCEDTEEKVISPSVMEQLKASPTEDKPFKETKEYEPSVSAVNKKSKYAEVLYESDIMLTRAQAEELLKAKSSRSTRQAAKVGVNMTLWDRTIPFVYDCAYPDEHKRYILYAMEVYEKATCLRFHEGAKGDHKLNFIWDEGCWSYMGKVMPIQELSLGDGCQTIGHSIHEIGHALGFFHTHARHDRDEHITVNFENIMDDYIGQFGKETVNNQDNLGIPYDYGSIMHYDQFDTGKYETLITIQAKKDLYQWTMGGYYESFYDLLMINKLYSCNADCANSTNTCENGGYPNPNNCTQCNCPRGFAGALCNERPNSSGCGQTLNATTEWQQFSDVLGNGTRFMTFSECSYWIKAPPGNSLEFKLDSYTGGKCFGGCVYGGIEIKAQEDPLLSGYRFCCNEPKQFVTNHSLVPIFTYNRYSQHNATVSYRYVTNTKLPKAEVPKVDTPKNTTALVSTKVETQEDECAW